MKRIPVTHAGSLIRPPELLSFLSAVDHGRAAAEGDMHRVHEEIQWAKLASLVEGARIASRELRGDAAGD